MKSFAPLSLLIPALFSSGNAWPNIRASASTTEIQDGQTGTLMVLPPRRTDTGTKRIPDVHHPFIAPGPKDQRGPCPAMNTLANHGYISRNGITTFEEIIQATGEAFNIDRDMASGMAATNLLTRGNPFVNKISIGGVSPFVPPLPFKIDGPQTQGIQKHGRVEGDASMTRADVFIGNNRNFNQTLFDMDLQQLAKFGDDGPDGPATVFNLQTLIEIKRQNLQSDQALDPAFAVPQRRLNGVFRTTKLATKRIISSFFMHQTFPENWFRAAAPLMGSPIPGQIAAALPQWVAGHNDENGLFVADPPAPAPFNISSGCAGYWDQLSNGMPGSLAHVRGIFKQNVDNLLGKAHFVLSSHISSTVFKGIMFNGSGCTEQIAPAGPTNV
ncbi:Chloroperoxidase [Mycena rebaudengoi]|nr:Chloroperoxidase [Mycena rebaudengoi]